MHQQCNHPRPAGRRGRSAEVVQHLLQAAEAHRSCRERHPVLVAHVRRAVLILAALVSAGKHGGPCLRLGEKQGSQLQQVAVQLLAPARANGRGHKPRVWASGKAAKEKFCPDLSLVCEKKFGSDMPVPPYTSSWVLESEASCSRWSCSCPDFGSQGGWRKTTAHLITKPALLWKSITTSNHYQHMVVTWKHTTQAGGQKTIQVRGAKSNQAGSGARPPSWNVKTLW